MDKHKDLLKEKFSHATDDLLYNSGGDVMWSLFRFENGSVTIYYHNTDNFYILGKNEAKWHSLNEIAEGWDSNMKKLLV